MFDRQPITLGLTNCVNVRVTSFLLVRTLVCEEGRAQNEELDLLSDLGALSSFQSFLQRQDRLRECPDGSQCRRYLPHRRTERDLVKCIDSVSSALRSSGDQPPATEPAIIPAIAAAGPKTEFELDLALRLALSGVFSGVLGLPSKTSATADSAPFGV